MLQQFWKLFEQSLFILTQVILNIQLTGYQKDYIWQREGGGVRYKNCDCLGGYVFLELFFGEGTFWYR